MDASEGLPQPTLLLASIELKLRKWGEKSETIAFDTPRLARGVKRDKKPDGVPNRSENYLTRIKVSSVLPIERNETKTCQGH